MFKYEGSTRPNVEVWEKNVISSLMQINLSDEVAAEFFDHLWWKDEKD